MSAVATERVLVLNKVMCPLKVVSVKRAVSMLAKGRAIVVDPTTAFAEYTWDDWSKIRPMAEDAFIRGVTVNYKIPKIIKLTVYDRLPYQQVKFSRARIYQRDKYTCQYCGKQPGSEGLNLDHVTPRCQGGMTTWENVVCACIECNTKKADKTPKQAKMRLRREPFKPKFQVLTENVRVDCWQTFLGEAYWNVELKNDNKDEE